MKTAIVSSALVLDGKRQMPPWRGALDMEQIEIDLGLHPRDRGPVSHEGDSSSTLSRPRARSVASIRGVV